MEDLIVNIRNLLVISLTFVCIGFVGCSSSEPTHFGRAAQMSGGLFNQFSSPVQQEDVSALKKACKSGNSDYLCLALKYVVFKNANDEPTVRQSAAIANLGSINELWKQCHVGFDISEYEAVDPRDYGLRYQTANDNELYAIRRAFNDRSHMLVVTTGTWDRSGSLGSTGANAWTSMPGEGVYGVVMEKPVGTFPNIIAHELGHYMSLEHVGNAVNLMNPLIYNNSRQLTQYQCAAVRRAVSEYWQKMLL